MFVGKVAKFITYRLTSGTIMCQDQSSLGKGNKVRCCIKLIQQLCALIHAVSRFQRSLEAQLLYGIVGRILDSESVGRRIMSLLANITYTAANK